MLRLLTLLMMLVALGVAGCGDDDDSDDGGSSSTTPAETQTQAQTQTQKPEPKPGECVDVAQPDQKPDGGEEKPTEELSGDYEVTFETNCGSFTIAMDEDLGGLSAASFVQLAQNGFFKNTYFHRIAPGFVIQGGDPTGTGTGGPGYTTKDPPPSDAQYPKYTVAMAKAGPEPPGTSGSQFFVMTGDSGLPPQYAIVGEVTKGMEVVDAIGKLGDPAEQPTRVVLIEKATVKSP